jgi:hypothetical protein
MIGLREALAGDGKTKKAGANEHPVVFARAGSRVAEPPGHQPGCSFNSLSDMQGARR